MDTGPGCRRGVLHYASAASVVVRGSSPGTLAADTLARGLSPAGMGRRMKESEPTDVTARAAPCDRKMPDTAEALTALTFSAPQSLFAAMDLLPVGVMLVHGASLETATVVHSNSAFAAMMGSSVEPGALVTALPFVPYPPDRAAPMAASERPSARMLGSGQVVRDAEVHIRRADGSFCVGSITVAPARDTNGVIAGALLVIQDITERKAGEDALRESRCDLNRAQAVSHTGSWRLDARRGDLVWSDETYRIFGIPKGTAPTCHLFIDTVHPDDREHVRRRWTAALRGERDYLIEHRILVGDRVKWVCERAELEFDADGALLRGLGTVQDITERKRVEDALRESEERERARAEVLRTVMDAEPAGIILVEPPDVRVAYANRRAQEIYERSDLGALPIEARACFHRHADGTPYRPEEMPVWRALFHGETVHGEEMVVSLPAGGARVLEVHAAPVQAPDGRIERAVVALQDITERKAAEEALREAHQRKDEFLAMLGHELRNPLAAISHAVHLIGVQELANPVLARARDTAVRQSAHMARLLDDLLDVARVTHGKIALKEEQIELRRVIDSAVDAAHPLIESRGQTLALDIADGMRAWGDAVRLAQVVSNLLNNAAKYTPTGGHIWLSLRPTGSQAEIRVRDDGNGIQPELLPHVFGLFVQDKRNLGRMDGGLGIGLTMAHALVRMHGGSIEARSDGPGRGSEFIVTLPLAGRPEPGAVTPGRSRESATPCSPRRILLVEDNADAAELLAMMLEMDGHEVVVAHSGTTALEMAGPYCPDVVLLDLGLPGMDGYEVAARLRKLPACAATLLVAVTGYGQEDDRQRTAESGFAHHLVKPIEVEDLRRVLAGEGTRAT